MYGGFLGAAGGVIGTALDGVEATDHLRRGRPLLATAYGGRALSTLAVSALSVSVALSSSGPYIKMLMQRTGSDALKRILLMMDGLARQLARQAVVVFMRTWLVRISWVLLAISAIIWILEPNAIEKWSDKSIFGKNRGGRPEKFSNEIEELAKLEVAFARMVGG